MTFTYQGIDGAAGNQRRTSRVRTFALVGLAVLCAAGSDVSAAAAKRTAAGTAGSSIVSECKADLAKRFKVRAQDVKTVQSTPTVWPDAALGMPEIGKTYAQVRTPGSMLILEARGVKYVYTTSAKKCRYGGPVSAWSSSMLYAKPVENEANLNNDLYQCSLLGTNNRLVVSGISEFYPQARGIVIAKRRTSRSGHDLLYVKADGSAKPRVLQSAMDFGDAKLSPNGDRWAGYVKPALGSPWCVRIADISGGDQAVQTLPMPEGVRPGVIAWSDGNLMIMGQSGERTVYYEINPSAATPEWKQVGSHLFPGHLDMVLNKSESLVIEQVGETGKPAVEVATVWFTGDRRSIARIEGMTLAGFGLLGSHALIWGEMGSKPVAAAVSIATGEVLPVVRGIGRDVKPFEFPPVSNPFRLASTK